MIIKQQKLKQQEEWIQKSQYSLIFVTRDSNSRKFRPIKQNTKKLFSVKNQIEKKLNKNYREYSRSLLTSYASRDENRYMKIIKNVFQNSVDFLKNIFSLERFKNDKKINVNEKNIQINYKECLFKLFLEFIDIRFASYSEEDNIKIFNWMNDNGIEEILEKELKIKMIHVLVLRNNIDGIKWLFSRYNSKQIKEIFSDNKRDIFNYVVSGGTKIKVALLIFRKFEESLADKNIQEKEKEIIRRKKKIKLRLKMRFEKNLWKKLEQELTNNENTLFHH